jgi:hypothetical protein
MLFSTAFFGYFKPKISFAIVLARPSSRPRTNNLLTAEGVRLNLRATSAALSLNWSTARQQTIARAREILLCLQALLMIYIVFETNVHCGDDGG